MAASQYIFLERKMDADKRSFDEAIDYYTGMAKNYQVDYSWQLLIDWLLYDSNLLIHDSFSVNHSICSLHHDNDWMIHASYWKVNVIYWLVLGGYWIYS